ncbi:hypothetical protein SB6420_00336 [Klebsiella pasteurii]|nr:hypothetical protein SB6420_00336 [Klebsiella pasteurii]
MATPAHLWLEDENGSPIVGSCLMPLRLGSIELKIIFARCNHSSRPQLGQTYWNARS